MLYDDSIYDLLDEYEIYTYEDLESALVINSTASSLGIDEYELEDLYYDYERLEFENCELQEQIDEIKENDDIGESIAYFLFSVIAIFVIAVILYSIFCSIVNNIKRKFEK